MSKHSKSIIMILALAAIAIISGGCTYNTSKPEDTSDPVKGIKDNPSINVMVKRAENWEKIVSDPVINEDFLKHIDGSTATIPVTAEIYRQFFDYSDEKINNDVYHATTHQAYLNLINRKGKDIIFVTEPSKEELKLAKEKGVKLEVIPIIREAFVFIVNEKNPINSLTVDQIQKIYTGAYKSWKELGDRKGKTIYAFQRDANSGSQTAMEQLVMKGKKMTEGVQTVTYMEGLIYNVADYSNYPGAIGYTYKYYLNNLYIQEGVKILNVNHIEPTNENLIHQKYPFATNYYAVIRSDEPADSPARKLRDWLLTDEGQRLVEMCGYCRMP